MARCCFCLRPAFRFRLARVCARTTTSRGPLERLQRRRGVDGCSCFDCGYECRGISRGWGVWARCRGKVILKVLGWDIRCFVRIKQSDLRN